VNPHTAELSPLQGVEQLLFLSVMLGIYITVDGDGAIRALNK
jgi:hypothetical protein